jgi:type VI secretion system protein ImpM
MGWYGKLPWVGDFVGHGLPWQRQWDDWLQHSLRGAEARLGATALRERVRGMAHWQWLRPGGPAGELGWCGLVAGSADRVGRVFPLVLAEGVPQPALDRLPLLDLQSRGLALSDWLWEAAALESLEQFAQAAQAGAASPWPAATNAPVISAQDTVADLRRTTDGAASFWWCTEPVADVRQPIVETWPPSPDLLLRLLETDAYPSG